MSSGLPSSYFRQDVARYTLTYLQDRYREHAVCGPLPDYNDVADAAQQLVNKFYSGIFDEQAVRDRDLAWWCGACLYALGPYGLVFEQLSQLTDVNVAQVVASITPDRRLPEAQRYTYELTNTAAAPPLQQLVRLADLQVRCHDLAGPLTPEIGWYRVELRVWFEHQRRLLESLHNRNPDMPWWSTLTRSLEKQVSGLIARFADLEGSVEPGFIKMIDVAVPPKRPKRRKAA